MDWMILGVGVLVGILLAGSLIRTEAGQPGAFGSFVGGLRSLAPGERLVLFEDNTSGAAGGWSTGLRDDAHVGLGAVWLVPDGGAPLDRRIALPDQTAQAILRLDLIAIDDWALDGLEVAVNGRPVLRQSFSSRPDLLQGQATEVMDGDGITLHARLDAPRELGFATGGAGLAETRLVIEMALDAPDPEVALSIAPFPAPGPARPAAPVWAVDNLIVTATHLP
jgi:hypothetical protein